MTFGKSYFSKKMISSVSKLSIVSEVNLIYNVISAPVIQTLSSNFQYSV